jgi:phosphoglycolate phosphatase
LNKRTIGFDFDQTLADSSEGIAKCLQIVCESLKKEVSPNELNRLAISGRPLKETLSAFVNESEIALAVDIFLQIYPTVGVNGTILFPNVRELIDLLKMENYSVSILSAKTHQNLILSLDHLNLQVDRAVGGLDFSGKVKHIQEFNLDFYIGDQITDMIAAYEAECKGILVNNSSVEAIPVPTHARFKDIGELFNNLRSVLHV